jgi:hypothetical protein
MSSFWREEGQRWLSAPILPAEAGGHDLPDLGIRFCRFGRRGDGGMALLIRPGVRVWVNGLPVLGGIRLLEHRDEILVGGQRFYYSAESRPEVVAFHLEAGERPPTCPVCRGQVREGDDAVQCPGCGRWHHQLPGKPCWTYAPTCRFCSHPTALTGEDSWRPEMEEAHV